MEWIETIILKLNKSNNFSNFYCYSFYNLAFIPFRINKRGFFASDSTNNSKNPKKGTNQNLKKNEKIILILIKVL